MPEAEAYIKVFFEEVIEISDDLEENLLNYEENKSEEIDIQIKRHFHTLKGDFATFDIEKYSKFFHNAEDRWINEENKENLIQDVLDKLVDVRDFCKIAEEKGFEIAMQLQLSNDEFDDSTVNINKTPEPLSSGFDLGESETYMKVFFEEINEISEELENSLLNYEDEKSEEINSQIKRHFHTLKGDFATFNISFFSKFFHNAEDRWKNEEDKTGIAEDVLKTLSSVNNFMAKASEIGIEKAIAELELKNQSEKEEKQKEKQDVKVSENEKHPFNLQENNSESNEKKDSQHINTFKLKFYEEKSLKLKEIEQLFNFYGKILEVRKGEKGEYTIVVDMQNVEEVRGMLEVLLIGEGEFSITKGKAASKKKKIMSKNTTELKTIQAVKVETKILDDILNTMSELIIKHSSLALYKDYLPAESGENYIELIEKINDITKKFQKDIFEIRLVQIRVLFFQLRRIVRDISKELDKNVELEIIGEQTKLDKSIIEKIAPPLKHMIKNSMDHGIESRGERLRKGKPSDGKIRVEAYQENDEVIIEIYDDGGGLDSNEILRKAIDKKVIPADFNLAEEEIYKLIFAPGFSTSEYVTEISGRGIGMDVVKNTIDELNGKIEIQSKKGEFTLFKIKIPATVSIINAFLVEDNSEKYIIPVSNIIEILDSHSRSVKIEDKLYYAENEYAILNLKNSSELCLARKLVLLIQTGNGVKALGVDDILDSKDFIIRDMNIISDTLKRYSGVTVLANGEVALALNPRAL